MKIEKKLYVISSIFGLLLGLIISHFGILNISISQGVSNGPPYCMFCVNIETSLLKPKIGDYARHMDGKDFVIHKIVDKNCSHYSLIHYWNNYSNVYSIPTNSNIQKIVYTFRLKTTEDFDYAWGVEEKRLRELDPSPSDRIINNLMLLSILFE